LPIEIRTYERLFTTEQPDAEKDVDFLEFVNPQSLRVSYGFAEPSLKEATLDDHFQFQRIGYYIKDRILLMISWSSTEQLRLKMVINLKFEN
jgi:glutaminyl-tRNA synthetase